MRHEGVIALEDINDINVQVLSVADIILIASSMSKLIQYYLGVSTISNKQFSKLYMLSVRTVTVRIININNEYALFVEVLMFHLCYHLENTPAFASNIFEFVKLLTRQKDYRIRKNYFCDEVLITSITLSCYLDTGPNNSQWNDAFQKRHEGIQSIDMELYSRYEEILGRKTQIRNTIPSKGS